MYVNEEKHHCLCVSARARKQDTISLPFLLEAPERSTDTHPLPVSARSRLLPNSDRQAHRHRVTFFSNNQKFSK